MAAAGVWLNGHGLRVSEGPQKNEEGGPRMDCLSFSYQKWVNRNDSTLAVSPTRKTELDSLEPSEPDHEKRDYSGCALLTVEAIYGLCCTPPYDRRIDITSDTTMARAPHPSGQRDTHRSVAHVPVVVQVEAEPRARARLSWARAICRCGRGLWVNLAQVEADVTFVEPQMVDNRRVVLEPCRHQSYEAFPQPRIPQTASGTGRAGHTLTHPASFADSAR